MADGEATRRELLGEAGRRSLLGQSFGGFCALTYLSFAPEGLREVVITGGLAGPRSPAEDVYRAAYPRVARKNARHYGRYPQDVALVREIAAHVRNHDVRLPDGAPLTVAAFQSLGLLLGGGNGPHVLHHLLEDVFLPRPAAAPGGRVLSDGFPAQAQAQLSFGGNPLYAVLHESIYGQRSVGTSGTSWAAQAVRAQFPAFDAERALAGDEPVLFTGEMIYPWMFATDPALKPLRDVAQALAEREEWPDLYDVDRLAGNEVPVVAAVYHDGMYVDTGDSLATAHAVRGLRMWVTDEFEHDGLRVNDGRVLGRLLDMLRGEA